MAEALATPTRFLMENGEWTLSPTIQNNIGNELNLFEYNFQERLTASDPIKDNTLLPVDSLQEAYLRTIPDMSPVSSVSVSSSTPSLSVNCSPTESTGSDSPRTITDFNVGSPSSINSVPVEEQTQTTPRRSNRTQIKTHYFSDFGEEGRREYKPRSAHVQSGRKRRIVFEGDDAEERRQKFLERNRIAAYKCRQKRKNWTQELEQHADIANKQNEDLRKVVAQLKEESIYLRNLLLTHSNCNCESVQIYLRKTSAKLTANIVDSNKSPNMSVESPNISVSSLSMTPVFQTPLDSTFGFFPTIPLFTEQSTGLTPFLNTSIDKSGSTDYFSRS